MTADEVIGKLHRACTQIRLAIAVYEQEVPEDESTVGRLTAAMQMLDEVRQSLRPLDGDQ